MSRFSLCQITVFIAVHITHLTLKDPHQSWGWHQHTLELQYPTTWSCRMQLHEMSIQLLTRELKCGHRTHNRVVPIVSPTYVVSLSRLCEIFSGECAKIYSSACHGGITRLHCSSIVFPCDSKGGILAWNTDIAYVAGESNLYPIRKSSSFWV